LTARLAWSVVAALGLGVILALPAAAVPPTLHARLNTSAPVDGELLGRAPAAVVLTFNRDIAPPASMAVTSPTGRRAAAAEPAVAGPVVTVPVATREQGTFTVGFRAVSVDGHPITGRLTFSVGHRSTPYARGAEARGATGGLPGWTLPVAAVGLTGAVGGGWWWRRRRAARTGAT
jgi:methionine-rich copper-binding protein CopC